MTNKRCNLTDRKIIALFKYYHPKSLAEVEELGINYKYYSRGCDRKVYRMGRNLILKIEDKRFSSYDQTPTEVKFIQRISKFKKYKSLRKHIPKLYYADVHNRITVLRFYPYKATEGNSEHCEKMDMIESLFGKIFPQVGGDFHQGNFRISADGVMVCVDLGV